MVAKYFCLGLLAAAPLAEASEPCKPPLAASPASAEDRALAEQHYHAGEQAAAAGRLEVAKIEFLAAHQLSREPDILYNLSVVAQRAGNLPEAIDWASRHLCEAGANLSEKEADQARGRLDRLRDELNAPHAGGLAPSGPDPSPSSPMDRSRDQPRQRDRLNRLPVGGFALVGAGSGLLLIGIGCGAGALATAAQFDGPLTVNQINSWTAQGNTLNAAAITLDVVGGLALSAGAAWLLWHRTHRRPETAALVSPL